MVSGLWCLRKRLLSEVPGWRTSGDAGEAPAEDVEDGGSLRSKMGPKGFMMGPEYEPRSISC